jgi:hypothetical protein
MSKPHEVLADAAFANEATAPTHSSIYEALLAAQQSFGTVIKGSTNKAFGTKYADLADVVSVVIPALNEQGCIVTHQLMGEKYDVMRTVFRHIASKTELFFDVPLIVQQQTMQGMKSATTYAKRIGIESLSGIAPDDDDGKAASFGSEVSRARFPDGPARTEDVPKKSAVESRDFFKRIVAMIRSAPDVDELGSLYVANRGEIEADKYAADIIAEFTERKTELVGAQ